ncbi:ROK family protein [Agromyces sp. Root81]|uniref:ROK family protein n=1 Tax=Agromyces sp. Root81 TaxID=1736601 RepID=UPI00138EFED8
MFAAAEHDARARAVVHKVARALALGASALSHAVDPQLVVLGGGLSQAVSVFGEHSVAHGAARLALEPRFGHRSRGYVCGGARDAGQRTTMIWRLV